MKPLVIILRKDDNSTIHLESEEIKKMISDAYEAGVEDGKKMDGSITLQNYPHIPNYPSITVCDYSNTVRT